VVRFYTTAALFTWCSVNYGAVVCVDNVGCATIRLNCLQVFGIDPELLCKVVS
jgi:hypothetical protein